MKLSEIADIIMSGKTNNMTVTIPEGYTIYQMADKLADEGLVDKGEKFKSLLVNGKFDYDFLKRCPKGKESSEGYLFPETYTIEYNADEKTIIETMLDQFGGIFNDEFKNRRINWDIQSTILLSSLLL